jgi:hypothetical protein
MPIAVEVNLRPNISVRAPDERTRIIYNAETRFITRMEVAALPRVGDALDLSTRDGYVFAAVVTRVDWYDEKGMFVVACQCAKKTVPVEAYDSLRADSGVGRETVAVASTVRTAHLRRRDSCSPVAMLDDDAPATEARTTPPHRRPPACEASK